MSAFEHEKRKRTQIGSQQKLSVYSVGASRNISAKKQMKKRLNKTTLLLACVFSAPAFAGFEWRNVPERSTVEPAPTTTNQPGTLNTTGTMQTVPASNLSTGPHIGPRADDRQAVGFGNNIPLELAVNQIVPDEWEVSFAPGVDRTILVSWSGNRLWREVLAGVTGPYNYRVVYQETGLRIEPVAGHMMATPAQTPPPQVTTTSFSEALEPPEMAPVWHARAGRSLHQTLHDWMDDNTGWTLAWESDHDYRLRASADFYGNFVEAAEKLIRTFANADPPLRGTFYHGNNVLVIEGTALNGD